MAEREQDPDLDEALELMDRIETLFYRVSRHDPQFDKEREKFVKMMDRVSDILEDWVR